MSTRVARTAPRFAARARRHRWRSAAPYVAVLTGVALLGVAALLVYGTGVFAVRAVEVTGARIVSAEQVRERAEVPLGAPLARVDLEAVRARVAAMPTVESVRVDRSWPGTVRVAVRERAPAAAVARAGRFTLVDRDGVLYRTVPALPRGVPLLTVRSPGPGDRATRAALTVLAALGPALRGRLVSVAAPTAEQVTLVLERGRSVFWGDAGDSDRKVVVATALLERPGTRIDVSAPGVVTVK